MADILLYPGTDILKNKFGIMSQEILDEMEAEYVAARMKALMQAPIQGEFDFKHLCEIHFFLFQDLYDWAGKPRIYNIEKPEPVLGGISVEYTDCEKIAYEAGKVLAQMRAKPWPGMGLKERAEEFSRSLAAIWRVHSFREGNTRTSVTLCCQFAACMGIPLDASLFGQHSAYLRNALVAASAVFQDLGDRSDLTYLQKIVLDSMERGMEQEKPKKIPLEQRIAEAKEKSASRPISKEQPCKYDRGR